MPAAEHGLLSEAKERLRAAGLHMTTPRRAVIAALDATQGHLSSEDVVSAVATRFPGVHRASVYRALEALTDAGVVQHVHLGHGATAYHLADDVGEHLHLQCDACGSVIDVPVRLLDGVRRRLHRDHGFALDATHVALSGTCGPCRSEQPQ